MTAILFVHVKTIVPSIGLSIAVLNLSSVEFLDKFYISGWREFTSVNLLEDTVPTGLDISDLIWAFTIWSEFRDVQSLHDVIGGF